MMVLFVTEHGLVIIGPSVTTELSPQITVTILRAWSIFLSENISSKFTQLSKRDETQISQDSRCCHSLHSREIFQIEFGSILTPKFLDHLKLWIVLLTSLAPSALPTSMYSPQRGKRPDILFASSSQSRKNNCLPYLRVHSRELTVACADATALAVVFLSGVTRIVPAISCLL